MTDASTTGWAARAYELSKAYGRDDRTVWALRDVTTGFRAGAFTAIMGPSGSGKSTLLQTMAGLDSVSNGRVFIGDEEITYLSPTPLTKVRRANLGFIFQSFNLVPSLTARQNIELPYKLAKQRVDKERVATVADQLGLAQRLSHRPGQLSGGQQQRVAVARALVGQPTLIFGDEPTGNLDSASSAAILEIFRRAVDEEGRSVAMVTHDPVAAAYADTVVFLVDGQVVDQLEQPTADRVIDWMKSHGEVH